MIRRWIENEQVLCALDSEYFESRYAFVCDEKGEIFKFRNRKGQQVFDNVIAEADELQVAIELLILKSRQQGITTKTALKFLHRMLFVPHTQAVMASVQAEKSELITRIIETCIERLPWWLPPSRSTDRIKMIGFVNGSILSVQSGNQATGIAQGWTPTAIHLCLTPNTLVRVGDGFIKPISSVAQTDRAITKEGILCNVSGVSKSQRHHEICREVWLWGCFSPLGCTLDHPIWTNQGWKRASEVKTGDWVRHPVRPITRTIERFRGTHIIRSKKIPGRGKRFWVHLNPAWGYICGLYLAEGSCQGNHRFHTENAKATGLIFSIHEKEIEKVSERVREAFGEKQYFNVWRRKSSASAKITVSVAHLARWMAQHFGMKDEKRIPDWVWQAGTEFCRQLVRGYLDGDGHYTPNKNEIYASSIRVQLPIQLRDLIASLGYGWSSIQYKSEGVYYERNCRAQWTLILNAGCGKAFRESFGLPVAESNEALHWKYDLLKENVDIEVETVADGFSESFYDLEVDHQSHSFLTAQCAVKNSEIGDVPNPKKTIEEGLLRATHSTRKLFLVFEGTGNGNTGWLADKWRAAKEDWPLGKSRLRPIFIPWPMCPDLYPEVDWLKKYPIPAGYKPLEVTRKQMQRCELYIRNTEYLAKVAGSHWKMPIEQQWFWEFNYLENAKSHTQKVWLSQMPADDYEALQGANDLVFDSIVIDTARNERKHYQAYAIVGDSIDDGFEPDETEIDYDKERIRVKWNSHRGQSFSWTMIPLLPFAENDERKAFDKVLVFEEPNAVPGHEGEPQDYSIGIDTADGLGNDDEDRSVGSITRSMTGENPDVQCAELASNRINSPQMVGFAACLASWYGENTRDPRGVKFAIEQRERPGDDCQLQLKLMGFSFHHIDIRYDSKVVKESKGHKEGIYMNAWSRPMLMTRFVDAVNNGWYVPNSPFLIEELGSLERKMKTGKSRLEHRAGKHDDRVLAAAHSYWTRHHVEGMAERSQRRYSPPISKLPEINYDYNTDSEVSIGEFA